MVLLGTTAYARFDSWRRYAYLRSSIPGSIMYEYPVMDNGLTNGVMRQYTHCQVPFVTRNGVRTTCDEGLFDILTLLKQAGVETHFSCQGDSHSAYICAFTPGMRPIVNKVLELHDKLWLSDQSINLVSDWGNGYREFKPMMGCKPRYFEKNRHVKRKKQHFSHERENNGLYGDRTTIRWPKSRTNELHQLLVEIQPHI